MTDNEYNFISTDRDKTIFDCPNCKAHNSLSFFAFPITKKIEKFNNVRYPFRLFDVYETQKFICYKCNKICTKIIESREEKYLNDKLLQSTIK
jgi:hypothetical protein